MYLNNSYSSKLQFQRKKIIIIIIIIIIMTIMIPSLWNCGGSFVDVPLHVTSWLKVIASYIVPLNLRSGGKGRSGVQVGLSFNFFAKIIK
jgi:hypothetical protein